MKKRMVAMLLVAGLFFGLVVPGTPAASAAELQMRYTDETADDNSVISGICGDDVTWELNLETGVFTVSGTGPMYDGCCWYDYKADIKEVIIEEGVTTVGGYMFSEHENLEKVTLPTSLTEIGEHAFTCCYKIKEVDIPENVSVIKEGAFATCENLEKIHIPGNVKEIGYCAFYGCNKLEEITLEEGVVSIGELAFYSIFSTTDKIFIPRSVTNIGNCALPESFYTIIHGYKGSAAEEYATTNGYAFQEVGGEPVVKDLKIMHSLTVQYGFELNFVVKADQLAEYDQVWLEYKHWLYEDNEVVGYGGNQIDPEERGAYLYFEMRDVTALDINTEIFARIYMIKDGELYTSQIDKYSVAQYAYTQLNKPGASAELKTVCANMLRYGSAMQRYKGYRTNALADSAMTQEHKAYLTDLNDVHFNNNNMILNDVEAPSVTWVGKTLNLVNCASLKVVVEVEDGVNADDLYLQVSYRDHAGNMQHEIYESEKPYGTKPNQCVFTVWNPGTVNVRSVLNMAVFNADVQVSPTLQYSMDTYGNNKTGLLQELCKAMVAYSDSVCEYLN